MAGTFQHTTLQQVIDRLSAELADSSQVHFTLDELTRNVIEAYRIWNTLTAYERDTVTFTTTAGTAFYDLIDVGNGPSLLGRTVTDRDVVGTIQYRLIEPCEPSAGSGMTDQFTFADILAALQSRRDEFLADTEPVVVQRTPEFVPAGTEIVALNDTIIHILRANWITLDSTHHPLRGGTDEGVQTATRPGWRQSPGLPRQWSVVSTPNLNLRLVPVPEDGGTLELFTIESGAVLDTNANAGTGTVLGVPDDVAAGPLWGAIATLCSRHGDGADPQRAAFATGMYALYVELARSLPTVLTVTINNVAIRRANLHMLDALKYGWQGHARGTPRTAAMLGDLIALYPVPDSTYSVEVEVVRRATIPALNEYLQIGREQLSAILAWARQLTMFKLGGDSISQGQRTAGELIAAARTYNEVRIADSQYLIELVSSAVDRPVPLPREAVTGLSDSDPRDTASSRNARSESTSYQRPTPRLGGR